MWQDLWIFYLSLILAGGPLAFFLTVQVQALREDFRAENKTSSWSRVRPWIGVTGWSSALAVTALGKLIYFGQAPYSVQVTASVGSVGGAILILVWAVSAFNQVGNKFGNAVLGLTLTGLFFAAAGCMFFPTYYLVPVNGYQQLSVGVSLWLILIGGSLTALLLWHIALANHVARLASNAGRNPWPYALLSGFVFAPLAWVLAANLKSAAESRSANQPEINNVSVAEHDKR